MAITNEFMGKPDRLDTLSSAARAWYLARIRHQRTMQQVGRARRNDEGVDDLLANNQRSLEEYTQAEARLVEAIGSSGVVSATEHTPTKECGSPRFPRTSPAAEGRRGASAPRTTNP